MRNGYGTEQACQVTVPKSGVWHPSRQRASLVRESGHNPALPAGCGLDPLPRQGRPRRVAERVARGPRRAAMRTGVVMRRGARWSGRPNGPIMAGGAPAGPGRRPPVPIRSIVAERQPVSDSKQVTFPVEASHIMMFARAIGDPNPVYHDAEAARKAPEGGIVAPPTFAQAVAQFDPDHPTRPRPGEKWFGSGATPSGIEGDPPSSGGLHAEQHFEYRRPLRPGDVLTATYRVGESWEKESRRAGRLVFTERLVDYHDEDGELVCRARGVTVKTERPVDQG